MSDVDLQVGDMRTGAVPAGFRSMMGLSYSEQLVVWGVRRLVVWQGVDPDLRAEFQAGFGADCEAALAMFCRFFRLLGQAARRPYEIAPPSTLAVLQDEQRILTLLAAAQLGLHSGAHSLLDAHLLWLATLDHRAALSRESLAFAGLLAAHGHTMKIAVLPAFLPGPDTEDMAGSSPIYAKPKLAWGS